MPVLGADTYVYMMAAIAVLGAVVVALAPFLVLESAPAPGAVQAAGLPATDQRPFWRRKRDFLRQTRSALGRLRSTPDGGLPVEPVPAEKGGGSRPSPEGAGSQSEADTGPVPSTTREQTPPGAAAAPPPSEASAGARPESEVDMDTEPEGAAKPTADDLLGDLSDTLGSSGDAHESDSDDESDGEDEDSANPFGKDDDAKPADSDSLFSLFSTEIVEENESGTLAATLENVDVRDLLSEAQQILSEISSARRTRRGGTPPR